MSLAPALDRNGLELLDRRECLDLLRVGGLGRLGLSIRALPVVLPVCYGLLGDDVVFRTGTGTKLAAAVDGAVVCFEADHFDPPNGGWSVCVTGFVTPITRPDELAAVEALGLPDLLPAPRRYAVRIHSELITGRRLPRLELNPA